MRRQRGFAALVLFSIVMLVVSACGTAAAPTATSAPSTPTPPPIKTTSPAPSPVATSSAQAPSAPKKALSGYPADRIAEMLAQNMYLATMQYGAGETPQYGGTAIFANKADPQNDDPMLTGSITMRNVFGAVTGDGGLVMWNRHQNDQFQGYVAQSWSVSDDFKTWTFKIRPDVKWHDGTTVVAEDLKWYIESAVNPPRGRKIGLIFNALPGLKDVQAVDPLTLRLVFQNPSPQLLEELASYAYTIAHQRKLGQAQIDKGNVGFGMTALGGVSVGPYKWDQYVKGSSFRSVRFDQYWEKDEAGRKMPYLDAVQNVIITDKSVTLGAFRTGRIDAMSRGIGASPDPEMISLIHKSLPGKVWFHRFPYLNNGLNMNPLSPPFDDVRVRRAVALYMDRDDACTKMYGTFCYGTGFTVPGVYWYSNSYANWPGFNKATKAQDREAAKQTIKDLGLVGTKIEQSCRIDYTFNAEYNEQLLRSLGFVPKINCMDIQLHENYYRTKKWQTSTGGSTSGGFPTSQIVTYTSDAANANLTDPKFDAWQKIILESTDPAKRREALWAAETYFFVEQVYAAPYFREEVVMPQRTYLKGTIVPGWAAHSNNDRSTDWIDKSLR